MVVMSIMLHRRPGLTQEAFTAHWREVHAPLVCSLAADLGIRSYLQVCLEASAELAPDGVALVGFSSREALAAHLENAVGRAAARRLRDDERLFLDVDRSVTLWGQAHQVI